MDQMHRWLRGVGMLKREKEPNPGLVEELFLQTAGRFACPECRAVGLTAGEPREEEVDWGEARSCDECGKPIPPERLEVFPDATVCAACKEAGPTTEREFCPQCGAVLQMRRSGGAGISRYVMVCPECGK